MDAFLANRSRPQFDEAQVDGARRSDLEDERVAATSRLLERTTAGSLASATTSCSSAQVCSRRKGRRPLPGSSPSASTPSSTCRTATSVLRSSPKARSQPRAPSIPPRSPVRFPRCWKTRRRGLAGTSRSRLVGDQATGTVRDETDPPPIAVRELVANALVHRDLADWASSRSVELRMTTDTLRLTNPGGLYGITTERLGTHPLTSARNRRLVEICKYVRAGDGNVVEALASGIPGHVRGTSASRAPATRVLRPRHQLHGRAASANAGRADHVAAGSAHRRGPGSARPTRQPEDGERTGNRTRHQRERRPRAARIAARVKTRSHPWRPRPRDDVLPALTPHARRSAARRTHPRTAAPLALSGTGGIRRIGA